MGLFAILFSTNVPKHPTGKHFTQKHPQFCLVSCNLGAKNGQKPLNAELFRFAVKRIQKSPIGKPTGLSMLNAYITVLFPYRLVVAQGFVHIGL